MSTALEEDFQIGEDATGTGGNHVGGVYPAVIRSLKANTAPKFNIDKPQLILTLSIEDEPGETYVYLGRSFGKHPTAGYSKLSKLIQAATGIPCGDKKQLKVKASELEEMMIRVRTETNEKGYPRVLEFLPY